MTPCEFSQILLLQMSVTLCKYVNKKDFFRTRAFLCGVILSQVCILFNLSEVRLPPHYVEFACSPYVCMGSCQVQRFPPTDQRHAC